MSDVQGNHAVLPLQYLFVILTKKWGKDNIKQEYVIKIYLPINIFYIPYRVSDRGLQFSQFEVGTIVQIITVQIWYST